MEFFLGSPNTRDLLDPKVDARFFIICSACATPVELESILYGDFSISEIAIRTAQISRLFFFSFMKIEILL